MKFLHALLTVCLVVLVAPASPASAQESQAYSVPVATLDAALDCTDLSANPDKEPVLLVHGTFTEGHEQFDWNYAIELAARGFDFCIVTYPDRGFNDFQVSAEYIARAMEVMHQRSGRKVDVMGHSQGALHPRWAVKFFPQAAAAADDVVLVAGPNHGIAVATLRPPGGEGGPAMGYQFDPASNYIEALNRGDETPGDIDYTSLYTTLFDELVQPDGTIPGEEPTAALDFGTVNPRVANVTPQQLCPGRLVDHLTIGTNDLVALDIVFDAFVNDGPADLERLDPIATCAQGVIAEPEQLSAFLELLRNGQGTLPPFDDLDEEPPLMPYARAAQTDNGSGNGSGNEDGNAVTVDDPSTSVADPSTETLPATGRTADEVFVLLGLALVLASLAMLRARRRT